MIESNTNSTAVAVVRPNPNTFLATSALVLWATLAIFWANQAQAQNVTRQRPLTQDRMMFPYAGFQPTVLKSEAEVQRAFNFAYASTEPFSKRRGGNDGFRDASQCFHRATVWQYMMDKELGIKSQKVFVFYTHKFREDYKKRHRKAFDWWFHVAPMVLVQKGDRVEERVLDPTFADGPLATKDWTDLFIETRKKCRDDLRFTHFASNVSSPGSFPGGQSSGNRTQDCFTDRSPMYDLDPVYLQARGDGRRTTMKWESDVLDEASDALPIAGPRGRFKDYIKKKGL